MLCSHANVGVMSVLARCTHVAGFTDIHINMDVPQYAPRREALGCAFMVAAAVWLLGMTQLTPGLKSAPTLLLAAATGAHPVTSFAFRRHSCLAGGFTPQRGQELAFFAVVLLLFACLAFET